MAGFQRVGAVHLVDDANQVEGIAVFVGAKHITHAVAVVENRSLDLLRDVFPAQPSAVVALVGVGVDEVDRVVGVGKVASHVLHVLQGILTVFQRRLDLEHHILDVAALVGFVAALVFLIESPVVGIGHDHRRIGDGGITQSDDIGRSLHILVLVIFLCQRLGKEEGCLHEVVELGLQTVLLQGLLEV